MTASSTCQEAPSLAAIGMPGSRRCGQAWQNDLKGFRMCTMGTISTGPVVISVSLNGHLLAHLGQGNTSKCGELICLSSLRGRSSARILSGKYSSDKQSQRNMPGHTPLGKSTLGGASQSPNGDDAASRWAAPAKTNKVRILQIHSRYGEL